MARAGTVVTKCGLGFRVGFRVARPCLVTWQLELVTRHNWSLKGFECVHSLPSHLAWALEEEALPLVCTPTNTNMEMANHGEHGDDDDMSSTNQATRHMQIMSYNLHLTNQSKCKAPHQ
jgi:hypothetical protein